MNPGKMVWWAFLALLLLPACEDKKEDYTGFSNLVAERAAARQSVSEEKAREKHKESPGLDAKKDSAKTRQTEEKVSPILYEREVQIVDTSSQKALAKGVAYINKQGQIVKIKLTSD